MQGNYLRKRSNEQDFDGGEFCEVISTLTHDLTKARNQLVRLMHQLKPGGDRLRSRLYGGYNGPHGSLRSHTPRAGSNACNRTLASGRFGCGKENPHRKSPSPQPQKTCRPMTTPGAKQFGQPQQRAPFAKQGDTWPQRRVSYSCERPQEREQPQQCNRNDMSDTSGMSDLSDTSDMNGQSDSTCLNIKFDSPEPAPVLCQRCRSNTNTSRSSKPVCLKGSCDPARLQGGSDLARLQQGRGRRHDMGTQFAAQLNDITFQLRERRLGANPVKKF